MSQEFGWQTRAAGAFPISKRLMEQPVDAERVADADDIARSAVAQAVGDVEVDLLQAVDVIDSAGIPELARRTALRIVADIFSEDAELLGQFLFDRERRLRD